MDESEEFEFRLRMERESVPAAPRASAGHGPVGRRAPSWREFNPVEAVGETALQTVTGAAAAVPASLAYAATAAGKAIGATDAEPRDVMSNIQERLTYQPTSRSSQLLEDAASSILEPPVRAVASAADKAASAVGKVSPTAETMLREAPHAASAAGVVLPTAAAAKPLAQAVKSARAPVSGATRASTEDPLSTLRAAGYKFRPSDIQAMKPGEKVPGLRREGLQEPSALKKDISLENQTVTTRLAGEDLGIKDAKSLMQRDYEKLREPHFKVYEDVAKAVNLAPSTEYANALKVAQERAGLKGTASVTETISALRRNARKRSRSDDVKVNKEGEADQNAADALEDALEAQLKPQGDEKLIGEYRESRKALAKIHDYETATRGGQVDAQIIRRLDKKNPGRFTGNAKIISDAADYGKNVVRHSQNTTGVRSSVKADSVVGSLKNAVGGMVSKLPGMDVRRSGFQNKFGREATPEERATFADYGKRASRPERPQERPVQPGSGVVEFTSTPGVPPSRSLVTELELAPEPVANPQQLPERPSMLVADVMPPVRGDIDFQASPDAALLDALAAELSLAPDAPYGSAVMPSMAPQMSPELSLLNDIVDQLGLRVDTAQPSLMTPVAEPVPFGPRVQLEPPPGKVGKPKAKK